MLSIQMPLKIGLREEVSFDSFVTESAATAISLNQFQKSLQQSSASAFYLQGGPGVGKTHLLQAACRFKANRHESAVYLPLNDSRLPLIADSLNGLDQTDLVCIDDIDVKIASVDWQKALANLLIKSQTSGNVVVFSGQDSFLNWPVQLTELNSALVSVLTLQIPALSKGESLVDALQRHAQKRGFELPLEVGNFLVKKFSAEISELMAVLHLLEQATLAEKRRLTLPFVKDYLKR